MRVIIINGPNLNLLGQREPSVYGADSFEAYFATLQRAYPQLELSYFQSNHEGALLDKLHEVGFSYDGIILNAGAYTHTCVALDDAIRAITTPVVEVHISNTFAREAFRHHSYISVVAKGVIVGFGMESYRLALESICLMINDQCQ